MPVNEKINFNVATARHLYSGDELRNVTIRGIINGRLIVRTFNTYQIAEQWLATHEATQMEIMSIS